MSGRMNNRRLYCISNSYSQLMQLFYEIKIATAAVASANRLGLSDVAVMRSIASCYARCDRYREATPLLQKACELRSKLRKGDPASVAAVIGETERGHSSIDHLPSLEALGNELGDALRCRGLDLEALEVYQVGFFFSSWCSCYL